MSSLINFLRKLSPRRTLFKGQSKYNGPIQIVEEFGERRLLCSGVTQSGGIIKAMWKKPLQKASRIKAEVGHCLILGLGGGTVLELIRKFWPKAKITVIEIDPLMVDLAREYFGISKNDNLEILTKDAIAQVGSKQLAACRYDLILVDLYLGDQFPKEGEKKVFLAGLKRILSKTGIIIFNRIEGRRRRVEVEYFRQRIEEVFGNAQTIRPFSNLFILATKRN